jgi:hypothetical protein
MSSPALLAIGDFSRATQLSVKMLRHSGVGEPTKGSDPTAVANRREG